MTPRDQLLALNDELRRLKASGQRTVPVTLESLAQLQAAVRANQESGEPVVAVASVPPLAVGDRKNGGLPSAPIMAAPILLAPPPIQLPAGDKPTRWAALREIILNDPVGRLQISSDKKIVYGVGDLNASIFFCAEAPGPEEESAGEPFVGPSGQLLTKMIQGMGLKREEVYLSYIMNWRPVNPAGATDNRTPTTEELHYGLPYLRAQLEIVQPRMIVALGKTAAGGLLGASSFKTLGEVKGRWHEFAGIPVMVTYHPSYILRDNSKRSKRAIWEDFLQVMERANLPVSAKVKAYYL